ncbi:MAG: hypothetical protein EB101_09300, partial [Chitinophagia bacterium]|nr:hypothetical protein [Chitinophagia bacterium]
MAGTETLTNKSINLASNTLTATSSQIASAVTDETGTGALVFGTSPSLTTPTIGGTGANFSGSTSGTTNLRASATAGATTITLPATTGTVVTTGDSGTVTSTMIADGTIVDADVNASASIAHSKLAAITAGRVLLGNASNVPTATALTGDITVDSSGSTSISNNAVTNTDLRDSSALSVIGNATNASADPADIAAASDHQILRRSGTALGFGAINLASTNAVTNTLPIGNGGTGVTATPTDGQLLIGNGTGFSLATLTAGSNVTINNTAGSIV